MLLLLRRVSLHGARRGRTSVSSTDLELDALAESAALDGAGLEEDAAGLRAGGEAALGLRAASLGGLTGLDVDARGVASESEDSSIAFMLHSR